MKTNNLIYKALSLVALLCLGQTAAWAQSINNNYRNNTIQHKQAKWYNLRETIGESAKALDTFNDDEKMFRNDYTSTDIQATHVYYDTLYVRKGSEVELTLPLVPSGFKNTSGDDNRSSARAYQRWYNFITEKPFSYSTGQGWNTIYHYDDILEPTHDCLVFANGYVSGMSVSNDIMARVTFHYPTDNEYSSYKENGFDNGSAGNNYYLVACDASGYLDFTSDGTKGNFSSDNDWYEPTLSLRAIYYIIGVDDRGGADETEGWKNGMGRLENDKYQGGDGTDKKFLEEYDITFPCDHLGNQSDELVALSKFANGYRIDGDSDDELIVNLTEGGDVFTLLEFRENDPGKDPPSTDIQGAAGTWERGNEIKISGDTRGIFFRKTSADKYEPWSVNDGETATIVVTKRANNTTYNIAKFNLTFKKDTRLLTQHELDRLDSIRLGGSHNDVDEEEWYRRSYQYRTPEYLRSNYNLLTSRTFDYDPDVAEMFGQADGNGNHWYYPFPLDWSYSSYAFFDGSTFTDFDGSTPDNPYYNEHPFAEWGYYAITNEYVGYGDKAYRDQSTRRPTNAFLGGKNADGYFLYVDASDKPGKIVTLPFEENLCPGTELFVSAWVKSADENAGNRANSAMLFTIYGVDAYNNKTPLYRQSTGQITTTSFLSTDDGIEYTRTNGYGSNENDWYQIAFSFVNNNKLTEKFVSYELQVDNNCGSTAGGDFYLDEIEVFISQPTAAVTQKDYTCSGERTLLSASLDWEQLCERTGAEADETNGSKEPENIDFCFIDEAKYNALIGNNASPSVEEITAALKKSVVMIGSSEDPDPVTGEYYDREVGSLYYNMVFNNNTEYAPVEKNLAINNGSNGKYYFYRTGTAEDEDRKLIVDFYSAMSPNTRYLMLIVDGKTDGTVNTMADFAGMYYDPCGIKSPVYVTSQTLVKVNGEVVDPQNDLCEGQTFNFTSQMRVPQLDDKGEIMRDPNTGEELFTTLDMDVYFDWFFGTEEGFNAANDQYGGHSLASALSTLRDIPAYRNVTDMEGVTPVAEASGVHSALTQEDINLIKSYLNTQAPDGGHHSKLVLHQTALDIAILKDGLDLVISPIPAVRPSDSPIDEGRWKKICWEYVPLHLNASGKSPKLFAGRNLTDYPEGLNPGLRIGLNQIETAKYVRNGESKKIRISLRGAEYASEDVEYLGLIDSRGDIDYTQIYLIETNDPEYTGLVHVEDFDQYKYPIGKILSLHAEPYITGSRFKDYAEVQFYLDEQTLADGSKFTFAPREGYTYTFAINFAERGDRINNSCWGSFPMTMKVVPEYLVWNGGANDNWNNDANWKRATKADIKVTDKSYTDYAEGELTETGNGFVPMLFSNVVMPKNSKVELYMAGYREGGGNASWVTSNQRPENIGDPTENIQYDLMVYDDNPDDQYNDDLTTQRYRVNICRDIHFEQGAQMLHAEQLFYNKAWMDVSMPTKEWTLVSLPLRDVVSGDWYTSTTGTQTELPYFKDITFNDQTNDRRNPAVYQRSWNENATIVDSPINNGNGTVGFSTSTPVWSAAYNDASVPYVAGGGYSLSARDVTGSNGTLSFRFPKADTQYDVSTGTFSRDNSGKLLVSGLLDRGNPTNLVRYDDVTQTLTPSQGDKYMIAGNPYMAPLDLKKFLEYNSGTEGNLTGQYWSETAGGTTAGGTDSQGGQWITPTGTETIEPFGAFFVQLKDGATDYTVKFTADMQKFVAETEGEAATTAFTITADNGNAKSGAALAYADNAENAFNATEDVRLMRNLLGNSANELSVYTVAGDNAASVNRVKDMQRIPLGLFAADGDVTTLTFTGVDALLDPTLYDAELNTETPITEGMELTVNGESHGRYFICSRGAGPGTTGISEVGASGNDVSVYSVVSRQVVISSAAALQDVSVYTVGGALLKHEGASAGQTVMTMDDVESGVAIVRVKTDNGTFTRKITVK